MAYQTNTDEFFDFLHQLLIENKVNETIHLLSDATSTDATLHGDLKFLKLRANKKLMVLSGGVGGTHKEKVKDVIKLLGELKKAHNRRKAMVSTLTEPSKKGVKSIKKIARTAPVTSTINTAKTATATTSTTRTINQSAAAAAATATTTRTSTATPVSPINGINNVTPKKKRAVWPWVLLFLLLGGGAAGYFLKDKITQNSFVQKILPAGWISDAELEEDSTPVKNTSNKKDKKRTTSSTTKPSKISLGRWYIQIASYPTLKQALDKRERIEMSFDRAIVLQKNINGKTNYRVVIPGFSEKKIAETFKKDRKVGKLHIGAFTRAFNKDCRDLKESESNIFVCQ